MAWDSAYTAQLTGAFQGMAAGNMAYAQQIGMSAMPGMASQQLMGGLMNRAYGVGAPLMTGAMGLIGLDPLSLGLKAGMASWGAGAGLMGAGLAGMGVAGAAAGGMAVAGYVGNQMMTGAQQQQQLNAQLRSGFNFFNPATGQQGFSSGQMGQIGSMMRHMTHDMGPGGEILTMNELSKLAGGMGQMGMANQVRDVQDFTRKFKEMVQTLKTVATEMGTSLQEAQQFVTSMKGSGIFRTADQLKYATQAKGLALSGGLALSELTAMGNIGAQISRSVGGLGRQGTFAGMNTIGQIGTATQMGIINEEDIYNATGLTGAEGRQALATSALQQSASFLRNGKGRRMLASLAGANGTLDEGAVQELLSGGMSISETMRNAGQNLSKIGRANFIRNEGRLRGAAMERLGGFLPAMQLREWADSKGIDINEMDDRAMLFAQRQLGMGRDEMDVAIRMAQKMPDILSSIRSSNQDQAFMDKLGQYRKTQGLEGIKTRFSQAREKVQGTLQKIGQDIFNEGSEQIERFMNMIAGTYEQRFSAEAENAYKQAGLGGGAAQASFEKYVGQAQTLGGRANAMFGGLGTSNNFFRGFDSLGSAMSSGAKYGAVTGAVLGAGIGAIPGAIWGAAGGAGAYLFQGQSAASKFKEAGYDMSAIEGLKGAERDAALRDRLGDIRQMMRVAGESPSQKFLALGRENSEWLQTAYANGSIAGGGEARIESFGKALMEHGSDAAKKAWASASRDDKIRMMVSMRGAAMGGMDAKEVVAGARAEAGMFAAPGATDFYFGGGLTKKQREERLAAAFGGDEGGKSLTDAALQGAKYGAAAGVVFAGVGAIPGAIWGAGAGAAKHFISGEGDRFSGLGTFLDSDEATDIMGGLMSADKKTRDDTTRRVNRELASMQDKAKTLSEQDRGKQMALQGMLAAKEYDEAMDSEGNVSEEKLKEIAKRHNLKPEDLPNMRNVLLAAEGRKAQERALGLAHKLGGQAVAEMGRIQATGIARFEDDKVTIDKDFAKQAGLDKGGIAYMSSMLKATAYEGKMAGATDADEAVGLQRQGLAARKQATEALEGMSVAEKRRLAQGLAKSGAFGQAGDVSAAAARHDSFAKNVSRKGVGGAAASALGITLSKEEQDALKGMNFNFGKDQDAAARLLAEKMGVGDQDDVLKDIKRALSSSQEGGKGVAKGADLLASVGGLKSVQDAQKKKREEAQAEKDPLQAKIAGLLEKVADATGKTAAALSGTLSVVDKSAGAADPDAKGGTK